MDEPEAAEPSCDLCGLPMELIPVEHEGHPAIRLDCLVHGERGLWDPHSDA